MFIYLSKKIKKFIIPISVLLLFLIVFLFINTYLVKIIRVYKDSVTNKMIVSYPNKPPKVLATWGVNDGTPKPWWVPSESFPTNTPLEESPFEQDKDEFQKFSKFKKKGLDTVDWDKWDWKDSYIFANISNVDEAEKVLTVGIILPEDRVFSLASSGIEKKVAFKCDITNSAVYADAAMGFTELGIDFLVKAKTGNYALFTKCLDQNCDSLGTICVLVSTKKDKSQE